MVFLLERLHISNFSRKAWTVHDSKEKLLLCQTNGFCFNFFFFLPPSPPPSRKNYSSYELPALGTDPPRFTDGTKLSWVRGLIWKFSSPGCAWLGANNSPSHLRTGEDYFPPPPPPPLSLFLSPTLGSEPVLSLGFSDLQEKKYRKKKLEDSSPGLFRNKEYFPLAMKRAFVLLWVGWMTVHPQLQLL